MVSKILIENQQRFLSMFFSYNNRIRFARLPSSCNVLDDICEVDRSNGGNNGIWEFFNLDKPKRPFRPWELRSFSPALLVYARCCTPMPRDPRAPGDTPGQE